MTGKRELTELDFALERKVYVYRNLTRGCWSVRALEGPQRGRVIGHVDRLWLWKARPNVSEKGRQRVLREGKKYVHAGITGHLTDPMMGMGPRDRVTYNPYTGPSFTRVNHGDIFAGAEYVLFTDRGTVYEMQSASA